MIIEENHFSVAVSRPELNDRRLSVRVSKPELQTAFPSGKRTKIVYSSIGLTGFSADNIAQAESYALAILEACVVARQQNAAFKKSMLEDEPTIKKFTVVFDGTDDKIEIPEWTDKAIEEARARVDAFFVANKLKPLKVNPNTNFPSFTVYENGVEVGGG